MTDFRKTLWAGAAGLAILLAACSPAETDPAPEADTPAEVTETDAPADTPVETEAETERVDLPPLGEPVLWTLADEDTTIHLFGTVHILKPDVEWRTDELDAALDSADAIYFEADVFSEDAQMQIAMLVPQLGVFTDGTTLSSLLDEDELREVEEAADIIGLPMAAIEPLKPWLASVQMSVMGLQQQGYEEDSGVEVVLRKEAQDNDVEIRFLETAEEQLRIFAGFSLEDQVDMLVAGSVQIEDNPTMLDDLVDDWVTGDVDDLALFMTDADSLGSEAIMEGLLVDRNENWNTQIQSLLADEAGTFLYAVGSAHLVGEDSVIAMLRADGFEVSGP